MEKKIVKDILFLSQVSHPASQEDLYLARDLQDTLLANRDTCVGLAANMIGVQKRVIIFNPNHSYLSQLDVTYKTPDLMSHFLPPHEVSFTFCCSSIVFPR
ncbi:polypeptide deformylase [Streptococcus pneumoniae]|nr:polypeptide deformylase [Streptococcus pneumoniae]